jgi:hypothetical protein
MEAQELALTTQSRFSWITSFPTFVSLAALAVLLASGCSGNPYHPYDGSVGYSESPVKPDEVEVGFSAPSELSSTQAHYYATVRAAEMALERDKPYFEIVQGRESARYETVDAPGTATINTTRTRDNRGVRSSFSTVNQTPGYTRTYASPTSILLVRFHEKSSPTTLDAREILRGAQQKGIKLSQQTLSRLNGAA